MPNTVSEIADPKRLLAKARLTADVLPSTWQETVRPPGAHDMFREGAYYVKFQANGENWTVYAHFETGRMTIDKINRY
jgi:hypothetical protein